jgi:hypothetical protein
MEYAIHGKAITYDGECKFYIPPLVFGWTSQTIGVDQFVKEINGMVKDEAVYVLSRLTGRVVTHLLRSIDTVNLRNTMQFTDEVLKALQGK